MKYIYILVVCTFIMPVIYAIESSRYFSLSTYDAINIIKKTDTNVVNYIEQQRVEINEYPTVLAAIFYKTPKYGSCGMCKSQFRIALFDIRNTNQFIGYINEKDRSFQADVFPLAKFVIAGINKIPVLFFIEGGQLSESGNYYSILHGYAYISNKMKNVISHKYEGYNGGNRGGNRCSYSSSFYGINIYNYSCFNIETTTLIPILSDNGKYINYTNTKVIDSYSWNDISNIYINDNTISNSSTNVMVEDEFWKIYYFQK